MQQAIYRLTAIGLTGCNTDRHARNGLLFAYDFAQFARQIETKLIGAFSRRHVIRTIEPERKFVAAQPRHEISRPNDVAQHIRRAHQHLIAHLMTQPVIDWLEIIEISKH